MRWVPIITAAAAFGAVVPAAAEAPRGWWGDYGYEWTGGRTAGGTGIVVTYRLHLGRGGCRIDAQGWQTDEHIRCVAQPRAGVLDVTFAGYVGGGLVNHHGVQVYRRGERLFSLSNRRGTIWTGWGSYSPWDNRRPLGRHFKRIG